MLFWESYETRVELSEPNVAGFRFWGRPFVSEIFEQNCFTISGEFVRITPRCLESRNIPKSRVIICYLMYDTRVSLKEALRFQ